PRDTHPFSQFYFPCCPAVSGCLHVAQPNQIQPSPTAPATTHPSFRSLLVAKVTSLRLRFALLFPYCCCTLMRDDQTTAARPLRKTDARFAIGQSPSGPRLSYGDG